MYKKYFHSTLASTASTPKTNVAAAEGLVHYFCRFIHAGENRNQEQALAEECDWWD